MILAFLITLLPSLLAYLILPKLGFKIRSLYLKVAFSWFIGMYLFTTGTFLFALLYTSFTSFVLIKAMYTMLFITELLLCFLVRDLQQVLIKLFHEVKKRSFYKPLQIALIAFCLLFSYFFFAPHVIIQNNTLYTSPIYWDFHWHAALIQNFVYGDNFPPENEAFAGLTHTYHYFWAVFAGIYEVALLDIAAAITVVSIIAFFFLLIALIGCSEEFFQSKIAGFITVLLMITSSSGHALWYFQKVSGQNWFEITTNIFTNTMHPWKLSLIKTGPFGDIGYNGTMFNLFYFLEERQMIFGVVYLLLATWILYKRNQFSHKILFILGLFMGAFFLWHLYITIMVLCALFVVLLFGQERKKTMYLLFGFCLVFGAHYLYFKHIMQSPWFYTDIVSFPRINMSFASGENQPFSLQKAFTYYSFSYGIKIIFFFLGSIYLWKTNRQLCIVLLGVIVPTFILLNNVQLSPSSIYENHKWLRPMNVIVDVIVGAIIFTVFFRKKILGLMALGICTLFFLTISGFIELMPFLNSKPTKLYAAYPSPIISAIWQNAPPKSSFVGTDTREILLAGRKVFLGKNLGGNFRLKKSERRDIIKTIYSATTIAEVCKHTNRYGITHIQFTAGQYIALQKMMQQLPHFTSVDKQNRRVIFVNVLDGCNTPAAVLQ